MKDKIDWILMENGYSREDDSYCFLNGDGGVMVRGCLLNDAYIRYDMIELHDTYLLFFLKGDQSVSIHFDDLDYVFHDKYYLYLEFKMFPSRISSRTLVAKIQEYFKVEE